MGIVDYLSRDPKCEPWPESVLDENFVITVKKDDSIKLALDAKPINRQLFVQKQISNA